MAAPIERSYNKLFEELRGQKAVGAVVAIRKQILWADVFASPSLFEKYWPKLIRSYAAEALGARTTVELQVAPLPVASAQAFLDDLNAKRQSSEGEPGVYRNTKLIGEDLNALILTSLLPGQNFTVHMTKMRE